MAPRPTHHKPGLSLSASIDLDVEGGAGGRLDEDYDSGWRAADVPWSAKGPASYAPRMSLKESTLAHLGWARAGWSDANRWKEAWRLTKRSSDVRNGVLKGLVLSSAVLALIFFFEVAFFPSHLLKRDKAERRSDEKVGHFFFLYPLLGLCYFLASSWTVDVAQATYKLRGGGVTMGHLRGLSTSVSNLPAGTSRKLLEESYRVLLLLNYTLVYFALLYVPWLGKPIAFAYMSFIDAYYCHEQALIARGWSLDRRMRYCESRWAYFIAFGIPSTLVSFLHPSPLVGIVVFMICFPIYSVLATISSPQPRIAPTSGSATTPTSAGGSLSAELSLFLPPRLPIFWPTIKAHRLLLRVFPPPLERSVPLASSGRWGGTGASGMGQYSNGLSDMRYNAPPMHGATGVDHGPGSTAGRRSAAQVVGGAWNYNTNASPRIGGGSPALGATANAGANGFTAPTNGAAYGVQGQVNGATAQTPASLPPPPKGPAKGGKKRD